MNEIGLVNLCWPIYRIGRSKPIVDDKVSYFLLGKATETDALSYKILFLDDRNIKSPSLGTRRLVLERAGNSLYKLKTAVFFLADLIKLANPSVWFIDSAGTLFQYTKTRRISLVYKKISRIVPIATGGCIIEVEGLSERFKSYHTPELSSTPYVGLLQDAQSNILYGFYDKLYKNTSRMI
jgi:hypothetical protein